MRTGVVTTKVGMSRYYTEDGFHIPVTLLKLDNCQVVSVKTEKNDGYNAVQIAYNQKDISKLNKAIKGHLQKCGNEGFTSFGEFRVNNPDEYKLGQTVNLETFTKGQKIKADSVEILFNS